MALTLLGTHPDAVNQPTALGRSLTALHTRNGKVWAGFGDPFSNTGPITARHFDPVTGTWTSVLSAKTELIGRFRPIGTELWSTNDDPKDAVDSGFCKLDGATVDNYTVMGHMTNLLSANASSVETNIDPWGVDANMTRESDTAWAGDGVRSLKITRSSGTGPLIAFLVSGHRPAVTPGLIYGGSAWVFVPGTETDCQAGFRWYDAAGKLLSETMGRSFDVPGGTAVQVRAAAVAPANAATVNLRVGATSTSIPVGVSLNIDQFSVHRYSLLAWTLGGTTTLANWRPLHVYDVVQRKVDDLYMCGSSHATSGPMLWRSTNNGGTWTSVYDEVSATRRFYNLGVLGEKVYTVMGDATNVNTVNEQYVYDVGEQCFVFDGTTLTRGPVLDGFIAPVNFAGALVYRGADNRLRSFDGATVTARRTARLHAIGSGLCWVVDGDTLYSSPDLAVWTNRGDVPIGTTSMVWG